MKKVLFILAALAIVLGGILSKFLPLPNSTARDSIGEALFIQGPLGNITAYQNGTKGQACILLFASAGREASDYNTLITTLNDQGYPTLAVEAGGIKGTDIRYAKTLGTAAKSLKAVKDKACPERPVILIGHAFGNRIVRSFAHIYPNDTERLILLAAGGKNKIDPAVATAIQRIFDAKIPFRARLKDIQFAFFADQNAARLPEHWTRGWHTKTSIMQRRGKEGLGLGNWEAAGGKPILVIQPLDDKIAPKVDAADYLKYTYPDQVTVRIIKDAGHALLPEQPALVTDAILTYLRDEN